MDEQELKRILGEVGKNLNASQKYLVQNQIKLLKQALSSSEIQRVNREMRGLVKNLGLSDKDYEALNKTLDKQVRIQSELVKASDEVTDKFYELYRAQGKNVVQAQRLADRTATVRTTLKGLGEAAYAGTGKLSDYTNVFQGKFGLVGDAIVDVGARLSNNIEAYRSLSNIGASFGQSLIQMRNAALNAGLPLADFSKLVQENSENLAALYGSSTQGATEFGKLSNLFRKTSGEVLFPLGLTVEDLNDVLLTQLTLQRRTGSFRQTSDAEQIRSAESLALELDKLSKLTGQQRAGLQKQIEAQLTNEKFLAFLSTQTKETQNRLSAFAASVGQLAPGLRDGFQDLIANAGVPVTQAAKDLVMNIPEASAIIQNLTAGTISSTQAMRQLRNAAERSNQSLRSVAQTGQVEFARLYGEVNKLATAKLDETAVTNEQKKRQDELTKSFTQFEDASKRLSSAFQSIETGFFAAIGDVIGVGGGLLNEGIKGISKGIADLNNQTKAVLFLSRTVGGYFLDKGSQILVTAAGVRLGMRGFSNFFGRGNQNVPQTLTAGGGTRGRIGNFSKFGAGGLGLGLAASAVGRDNDLGKLLDIGSTALSGAALGSLILPGIGTAIGGVAGGLYGLLSNYGGQMQTRARGTQSSVGLQFEPRTALMQIHKGETVLNAEDTKKNKDIAERKTNYDAQMLNQMMMMNQISQKQLQNNESTLQAISTLVGINAKTEQNTGGLKKGLAKLSGSII